ncbi:MAG: TIGR00303 family protein [Methanomassiliicoccus sp.]|nr:TIGR00303 family protein [Methanomassiliicoccus sp.]
MSFKVPEDITICLEEEMARKFLERIWGKQPTYACVIGNTETAKIPGLSAAGANPEATDFTPAADMELLFYGKCKCIDGVPVTPDGIPTPGIVTMSSIKLSGMPFFVVNGGLRVRPHVPYFELDGAPGDDIRTGRSVKDPEKVYDRAVLAGQNLAKISNYLVIAESIPGGTTTALGVLTALGYEAYGKVSSTLPANPHELKLKVVEEGLKASGMKREAFRKDPMAAIEAVGDPMMAAAAGLAVGAAETIPVLLAGGTQMAAVLAIIKGMDYSTLNNIAIGTTRWITKDGNSDIRSLVSQIGKVPVLSANLNFSLSRYDGLKIYETGLVKEGVGAGGSSIAAMAASEGKITAHTILDEIEKNYARLVSRR